MKLDNLEAVNKKVKLIESLDRDLATVDEVVANNITQLSVTFYGERQYEIHIDDKTGKSVELIRAAITQHISEEYEALRAMGVETESE